MCKLNGTKEIERGLINPVGLKAEALQVLELQHLWWALQSWRLPYISGMMKTEMSSPEPRRSLVILQPRSLSTPRARITRSCAAIVYLNNRGNNNNAYNPQFIINSYWKTGSTSLPVYRINASNV